MHARPRGGREARALWMVVWVAFLTCLAASALRAQGWENDRLDIDAREVALARDSTLGTLYLAILTADSWVRLAVRPDGCNWTSEIIPGTQGAKKIAMALDPGGTVHVLAVQSANDIGRLTLFTRPPGGSWNANQIIASGVAVSPVSIDLDASGRPHVAFAVHDQSDPNRRGLCYGWWPGQGFPWDLRMVSSASAFNGSRALEIALSPSGEVHMMSAYLSVRYWTLGQPGKFNQWLNSSFGSLALDAQGNPHVAMISTAEGSLGALQYARSFDGGSSWLPPVQVPYEPPMAWGPTAIALRDSEQPRIAYWTAGSLMRLGVSAYGAFGELHAPQWISATSLPLKLSQSETRPSMVDLSGGHDDRVLVACVAGTIWPDGSSSGGAQVTRADLDGWLDQTPPPAPGQLLAVSGRTTAAIYWTAVADPPGRPAKSYDLRVSSLPINTVEDFNLASRVAVTCPQAEGSEECASLVG